MTPQNEFPYTFFQHMKLDEKYLEDYEDAGKDIKATFWYLLYSMPERMQRIVIDRFQDKKSIAELAVQENLSGERIRQIIDNAAKHLTVKNEEIFFAGANAYNQKKRQEAEERMKTASEENYNQGSEAILKELHSILSNESSSKKSIAEYFMKRKSDTPTLLKMSIEEFAECMKLSVRIPNALKRAGYTTLESVLALTEDEIRSVRGLGESSCDEFFKKVESLGFIIK